MILVYGNINVSINLQLQNPLETGVENIASCHTQVIDIGGHGAMQAISAARCGAKVALITSTSDDLLGEYCLNTLRKEGIQTSRIVKTPSANNIGVNLLDTCNNVQTSIITTGHDYDYSKNNTIASGINGRSLVVISDNLPPEQAVSILDQCRNNNATSIFCITKNAAISGDIIDLADIIIMDQSATNANPHIKTINDKYIVVTKDFGTTGATAKCKRGQEYSTTGINETPDTNKHTCLDVFCGYLAACIQAGLKFQRSLEIATKAAGIAAQKQGSYTAIPYLGYLEDIEQEQILPIAQSC